MQTDPQAAPGGFDNQNDRTRSIASEVAGEACFRSHAPRSWRPRINLYEMDDRYIVCVELAGMSPQRIDLRWDRLSSLSPDRLESRSHILKIRGDRPKPAIPGQTGDVSVHLMEIDSGPFSRKLPLPADADVDRISATYRQGYLWIFVPRTNP